MQPLLIPVLPTTIQGYVFTAHIGSGGYGEVYKVVHPRFSDDYAAKVLVIADHGDPQRSKKWDSIDSEVSALCGLNHPNIIRMYDYFREGDFFIMILEFCPGGDLQTLINNKDGLPADQFVEIANQIVSALHYCHSQGIAHHDIKPSNILFDQYGRVKLADFGCCEAPPFSGRKERIGTLHYVAPELLTGRRADNRPADIWSLGILYFALSMGALPFYAGDDSVVRAQIVSGALALPDELPELVATVVNRCCALDPADRITMRELLQLEPFRIVSAGKPELKPVAAIRGSWSLGGLRVAPKSLTAKPMPSAVRGMLHNQSACRFVTPRPLVPKIGGKVSKVGQMLSILEEPRDSE